MCILNIYFLFNPFNQFVSYFLEGGKAAVAPAKASNKAKTAANARVEAAAAAKKVAAEKAEKAKQEREAAVAAKKLAAEKVKQEREAKAAAAAAAKAEAAAAQKAKQSAKKQEAQKTVTQVKRSPTISLFGLGGGGGDQNVQPSPAPAPPAKKQQQQQSKPSAPKGVPTVSNWKLNGDGSISGRISGSPNFRDGENVTTSQIAQGRIEVGAVVKTGSGSRYFLG
mmetsp:Transcript_23756/g.41679  ORF Transcript_23756/g.41679 Transcript_23756/m.41679 type:complete len:224 (+) Transcript_23756:702-1373(+)